MKIDCDHIGYEVSWEDSLLDVVDNFIHRVFQQTVKIELVPLNMTCLYGAKKAF